MLETAIEEFAKKERDEGRDEGRHEALVETARKALAKGMSPQEVADPTDLPLEEVHKLAH